MPSLTNNAKSDDVMTTLLLAVTDPNSPYFLRAMAELRAMLLQQEYDSEKINRIIVALLNDKDFEKDLLVQEQLEHHQRELHTKYMEAWNTYQQEIHQNALDDINLAPDQLRSHLLERNAQLKKEIEVLETQLLTLDKDQTKIKEDWEKNQNEFAEKYAEKLKTGGEAGAPMSIVSADGKKEIVLNDNQIERLQNASKQPNIIDLLRINPSLAVTNEANVEMQTKRMGNFESLMREFQQIVVLKEIMNEMDIGKDEMSAKELLGILKKNTHISKALNDVNSENPETAKQAREIIKAGLVTNEVYINAQIEMKKNQMQENTHRADNILAPAQKTHPTTPQFKPNGANSGKSG